MNLFSDLLIHIYIYIYTLSTVTQSKCSLYVRSHFPVNELYSIQQEIWFKCIWMLHSQVISISRSRLKQLYCCTISKHHRLPCKCICAKSMYSTPEQKSRDTCILDTDHMCYSNKNNYQDTMIRKISQQQQSYDTLLSHFNIAIWIDLKRYKIHSYIVCFGSK